MKGENIIDSETRVINCTVYMQHWQRMMGRKGGGD